MDDDTLFIRTLGDLAHRLAAPHDEYEVLGIAALVRKLLLDEHPLAHRVNCERRLELRFTIDVRPPIWQELAEEPPTFWSVQDGLDPETSLITPIAKPVSLDAFLGTMVMHVRGRSITVREVILHTANVVGAVHRGPARTDAQAALAGLDWTVGGYQPDIRSLRAIGRVVLRALAPLYERILEEGDELTQDTLPA